jgi:pimeloyl-ACP methyl ester carboxylesterase
MKNKFVYPLILLSGLLTLAGYSQIKKIPYGNNPAAGKYYSVRGIKMYTETYGNGKPLLIHIDSAYVIGWSDGGINALLLAMRHPDKVIKLISTGANLTPDSLVLIPSLWYDEQKQFERDKNKIRTTAKEKNDWKVFMLDWLQPNVPLTDLSRIKCPSLIISGDSDLITLEHTAAIYRHIPKAYLWILPHSGHATLQIHRDDFNRMVNAFFEQPFDHFSY